MSDDADALQRHLPLTPHVFEILLSLSNEPRHGYGIIHDVRERTGGAVTIGTSTLYASIRRLLELGFVRDEGDLPTRDSDGPPRRYYAITESGRELALLEAARVQNAARAARNLLRASAKAQD
jgi:DNA-binding PadR family transcriptional regulator